MSDEILLSTFERLRARLLSMAGYLLHDDEEAQDVLQEAFCRLWTHYRGVDSSDEAEALSVTTVKNLSISGLRRHQREDSLHASVTEADDVSDSDGETRTREEQFRTVELLIKKHLTPLQENILHRRELHGEGIADIAADLNMSETAVRMHLSRARRTIRQLYQQTQKT